MLWEQNRLQGAMRMHKPQEKSPRGQLAAAEGGGLPVGQHSGMWPGRRDERDQYDAAHLRPAPCGCGVRMLRAGCG